MRGVVLCLVFALACAAGCSRRAVEPGGGKGRLRPVYDKQTGKLTMVTLDSKKDGKIDTWSYMDGARIVRIEIDNDGDGKVDRWEYYGADQKMEKIGISRLNDGKVTPGCIPRRTAASRRWRSRRRATGR